MSDEENIARTRPRRSTAGNRMQAALAEIPIEDGMEDDGEFINEREEEDVFESDFESTDDEAAQAEMVTGEKEVQEEERKARKQAKSKLEKVTAAADARFRVTFNPDAVSEEKAHQKQKQRRRVSLGLTINAETGEVIAMDTAAESAITGEAPELSRPKVRHSQRKHTIQNTVETVKRLKTSEEKKALKATTPKKAKVIKKKYTQGELLARALDNEEGNIVEHRDYLMLEEEKRKRAKVIRTVVDGPLVRWVSRLEQVQVTSQPPLPPLGTTNAQPTVIQSPLSQTTYVHRPKTLSTVQSSQADLGGETKQILVPQHPITTPSASSMALQHQVAPSASTSAHGSMLTVVVPTSDPNTPVPAKQTPQAQPVVRNEIVAKSYVIHELNQRDGTRKPNWAETMKAMFGDHVRWDEVRVYIGKGRPLSRPKHICPITGKQAPYIDPRTGVPYADVRAFKMLTGLLEHEYIWDAELGCYVRQAEEADDV